MGFSTMILSVFIGVIKENIMNIMNKEIIIELREYLLDGGWKGSVDDLTVIIAKIEKHEAIKRFIFLAKARYERSFKDMNKQTEAFMQLENDLFKSANEYTYYNYYENANCLSFFEYEDDNKAFVEYKFGQLFDDNYDPVRKRYYEERVVSDEIVITENKLFYKQLD